MKQKVSLFAVLLIVLAMPNGAKAYDFSAVAPSGQTLYYSIYGSEVYVTYPGSSSSSPYSGYTIPTGDLTIPDSVTHNGTTYSVTAIGYDAFYNCSGLSSVTIPNSVTSIGNEAFRNCSGLTSVTIPYNVTAIGNMAFGYCSGLTSVIFNADSCVSYGGYGGNYSIFGSCNNLTSIMFGNNVKQIPDYLCCGCSSLSSVTIPNCVSSIGNYAFYGCNGLTSVNIGSGVTSIGNYAFAGCIGLISVNYNGTISQWCNISFSNRTSNPINYVHLLSINGNSVTNLVIPDSVTSIGNYAFSGCSDMTSVNIGSGVTSIGNYAFSGCSDMTSVNIGSGVTSIGDSAFYACRGLTSVTIPNSVISIGNGTFSDCYGLTSITIGSSVTSIGNSAFHACHGLTSVTIPNSVISIGNGTFSSCYGLTSVIFNADSCFSHSIFNECGNLTNITFGNNVKIIPQRICRGCTNLTSVIIGSDVEDILEGAFSGCSNLSEIQSLNSVAPRLSTLVYGEDPFNGIPSTIPVYIPCGCSASYYSRWSYFSNFIEEEPFTFTATSDNVQMGTVQILTMPSCTNPQAVIYASANSGYHFDHWSDGSTANPYSLTVTDNLDLIGYFASDSGTEGVDDIDVNVINIYMQNGRIILEGVEGMEMRVYDLLGREIVRPTCSGETPIIPKGVYLVKVGTLPAKKVVVIR